MLATRPIGVFDSGVGGLSVLQAIRTALPQESLYYVADCAHIPYGEKSQEYIVQRCLHITDFLLAQGCKALVVACNTATAAAIMVLRQRYPQLIIIGMEPAIKPAVFATKNNKVGVLATSGTLKSSRFAALLGKFASDITVVAQACPGLVEQVEAGLITDNDQPTINLLRQYTQPMLQQGCDTIILGCTHYPFLKPLLLKMLPQDITLIDTGPAVAKQLTYCLQQQQLLSSATTEGITQFWSSAAPASLAAVLPALWGYPQPVSLLPAPAECI